jgi:hypothetical protein
LVITDATVSEVEVWSTSGSLLRTMSGGGRTSVHVELTGVAAGSYLLAVRTAQGQRMVRGIVR